MDNNRTTATGNSDEARVLLRPRRVAAMLDMPRSTVYEKINSGELPSVRIGRSIRVPADAIRKLLEQATDPAIV
jgi:excisionase family DNA binding protein